MLDKELIIGLKNGDQEVFRNMIEQYQVPLVRLCKGFLHNDEDAKDVVQETFIEVFESVHHFRSDSRFSTWIYRVAVNKSLNLLRKNKMQQLFVKLDVFSFLQNEKYEINYSGLSTDESESHLEKRQKMQQISHALDTLAANQRIAFVLNKYQELTYLEIAEVMEISLSSVESLIHRAKINLQKKLYKLYKKNLL